MLLADSAQAAEGKLYVLGGGWSVTGPGPVPSAIAMKLEVPWDQANMPHHWELFLIDGDGQHVFVDTTEGTQPVEIRGDFEVGRPPGVPPGTPIDLPIAINISPMPLHPGSRFTWRLVVDGETHEDWELSFTTRPAAQEAV